MATGNLLGLVVVMKRVLEVGRPIYFIGSMRYGRRKPIPSPLMEQVIKTLNYMWLYQKTQLLLGPKNDDDRVFESGSVYVFVRRDSRTWEEVQKLTPKMGRMVIFLDDIWPYPVTMLSLGPLVMMISTATSDIVTCTPILAGSGLRMAR